MTSIALRRAARPAFVRSVIAARALNPSLRVVPRRDFSSAAVGRSAATAVDLTASDVDLDAVKRRSKRSPRLSTAEKATDKPEASGPIAPAPPAPPSLRPYQAEAVAACLEGLERGLTRIGVSSPTGSGKTVMFMSLIPQVRQENRHQALIIVGSVELALQAEAAAKRILGDSYTVEVEQARRVASGKADVTIATYQTLNNAERLGKFDPDRFKLVIVDEAHHAAALSYLRLLHYFNDGVKIPITTGPFTTFDHGNKVPIIGFSATFTRHDQLALSAAFEEIVFHREVGHMLEEGWLSSVTATSVHAELNLDKVGVGAKGDYLASALGKQVNTPATNSLIVRTWLHKAVFAVNLSHVAALVDDFRAAGVDARSISGHTDAKERKDTIAKFAAGEFPVLVNCEVLTEGTDIREIDCIVLARPTKSKNLLAQMVGRGLRLSPETGKEDCFLLDIEDNITKASGMQVDPTLFGLSYEDGVAKQSELSVGGETNTSRGDNDATVDKVTLVDHGDPFALGRETQGYTPLPTITYNAWVACGNDRFVLEMMDHGYLTVQRKTKTKWLVTFTEKLSPDELLFLPPARRSKSPYRAKRQIAEADTMQRAIQTADKYAEQRLGYAGVKMLARAASWRSKPATPKQIALLANFRQGSKPADDYDETNPEITVLGRKLLAKDLTGGKVAAFVTALKHGAGGVQKKKEEAAARLDEAARRQLEKEAEHAARNLPLPASRA